MALNIMQAINKTFVYADVANMVCQHLKLDSSFLSTLLLKINIRGKAE